MRAAKVLTVVTAVAATVVATLATAPAADAQTPHVRRHHAPARVTVHRRSYLDPGTETKTHAEHYSDYLVSPSHGYDPMRNSALFQNNAAVPFIHDRMPFPTCLDLSGFCQ